MYMDVQVCTWMYMDVMYLKIYEKHSGRRILHAD